MLGQKIAENFAAINKCMFYFSSFRVAFYFALLNSHMNVYKSNFTESLNHNFKISADWMTTELQFMYNEITIRISLKDTNKKVIIKTHLTSANIKWFYFAICWFEPFLRRALWAEQISNLGWKYEIIFTNALCYNLFENLWEAPWW